MRGNHTVLHCFACWPLIIRLDRFEWFIYKIIRNNLSHTIVIERVLTVTSSCCNSRKSIYVIAVVVYQRKCVDIATHKFKRMRRMGVVRKQWVLVGILHNMGGRRFNINGTSNESVGWEITCGMVLRNANGNWIDKNKITKGFEEWMVDFCKKIWGVWKFILIMILSWAMLYDHSVRVDCQVLHRIVSK
jgi:hypothetical protein